MPKVYNISLYNDEIAGGFSILARMVESESGEHKI